MVSSNRRREKKESRTSDSRGKTNKVKLEKEVSRRRKREGTERKTQAWSWDEKMKL